MDESFDMLVMDNEKTRNNQFEHVSIILWHVRELSVKEYLDKESQTKKERILQLVWVDDENETSVCHLRGDWFIMEIEKQDIVYVSGKFFLLIIYMILP